MQNVKDTAYLKKLGQRIKVLRLKKGLTQLDLAVRMDNYAEQIGRIERGKLNVTICTLKKVAECLEVSIAELIVE